MTMTLEPERIVPRVANLSARVGQGEVVYPQQFFEHVAEGPKTGQPQPTTRLDLAFVFEFPRYTALVVLLVIGIAALIVSL